MVTSKILHWRRTLFVVIKNFIEREGREEETVNREEEGGRGKVWAYMP